MQSAAGLGGTPGANAREAVSLYLKKSGPLARAGLLRAETYSNGFGAGVLSEDGGRIGIWKEGCSPVSVFRKATI